MQDDNKSASQWEIDVKAQEEDAKLGPARGRGGILWEDASTQASNPHSAPKPKGRAHLQRMSSVLGKSLNLDPADNTTSPDEAKVPSAC